VRNEGIFIIGASGLIGSSLAAKATKNEAQWIGTTSKASSKAENSFQLDLTNDREIDHISLRPRVTYLCAGATNIQACESDPIKTGKLNVQQTMKVARLLHEAGSAIVFLSSNLVFDGNQSFTPAETRYAPTTEYGRQKAEAESMLLGELEHVAIVRLTKVVNGRFPLFRNWLTTLRRGEPIHPFSDMQFSPVEQDLVAEELWALSNSFKRGIFQLSGDADISYAAAAQKLAKYHRIDDSLVRPQIAAEGGFHFSFPRYTTLAFEPVRKDRKPEATNLVLERIFRSLQLD
jgi:dTDP-4-dehydrorhamnose reductase